MKYYDLKIIGLKRQLPIVALGPKLKIASFNLLGDRELVNKAAQALVQKIKDLEFDYLVGPEVKVVPLLHEMANILKHDHYVICRKTIMGYMVKPISSKKKPLLVLDGRDAELLEGKKVIIVDDVVSTGRTTRVLKSLMLEIGAQVVAVATIFKQGDDPDEDLKNLIYLAKLPLFDSSTSGGKNPS